MDVSAALCLLLDDSVAHRVDEFWRNVDAVLLVEKTVNVAHCHARVYIAMILSSKLVKQRAFGNQDECEAAVVTARDIQTQRTVAVSAVLPLIPLRRLVTS